jgi:uncharacterized UBP type Zn finger protein
MNAKDHSEVCTVSLPADCVECQMHKVADGSLSGRYSHLAPFSSVAPTTIDLLRHPSPTGNQATGFKALTGKGHHEEFSAMKQQDSEEFDIQSRIARIKIHTPSLPIELPSSFTSRPYNGLFLSSMRRL